MFKINNEYEILTPNGWSDFEGIKQTYTDIIFTITTDNNVLECSFNHKLKLSDGSFLDVTQLRVDDTLFNGDVVVDIKYVEYGDNCVPVYDIIDVSKDNEYYTNNIVSHNCAFIPNAGELWTSLLPTLSTGGGCIALSTPNGAQGWFYDLYTKAEQRQNSFLPIKLKWNVHPDRDQAWRDQQEIDLGDPRRAAQECDAEFTTSGGTWLEPTRINEILTTSCEDPLEKRGVNDELWIWKRADYNRSYMVTADVARGDGADNSAFQIIDIDSLEQVAEFKGQPSTTDYGHLLVNIATEYNNALLVVDNANIGWNTIQTILERGYSNLYHIPKSGNDYADTFDNPWVDNSKLVPGFNINQRNRPQMLDQTLKHLTNNTFIVKSKRLVEELRVFMWNGKRAEAARGHHDDLIMALAMGLHLLEASQQRKEINQDTTRAALNNISRVTNDSISNSAIYNNNSNLTWNVNGQTESLKWLY